MTLGANYFTISFEDRNEPVEPSGGKYATLTGRNSGGMK